MKIGVWERIREGLVSSDEFEVVKVKESKVVALYPFSLI